MSLTPLHMSSSCVLQVGRRPAGNASGLAEIFDMCHACICIDPLCCLIRDGMPCTSWPQRHITTTRSIVHSVIVDAVSLSWATMVCVIFECSWMLSGGHLGSLDICIEGVSGTSKPALDGWNDVSASSSKMENLQGYTLWLLSLLSGIPSRASSILLGYC